MAKVKPPTNFDVIESLNFIWDKLHDYREILNLMYDDNKEWLRRCDVAKWDDICTAMSWIEDGCNVERIEGILEYKKERVENE
jgi:hypothetical protein